MKRYLLVALFALMLPCWRVLADGSTNATEELNALVMKVQADINSGKRTEADFADDIKQFDFLLAEHKSEKTDAVAHILFMKAMLYFQVIHDTAKSEALIKQLTNDFSGTAFVTELEREEAQAALVVGTQFPDFNEKDIMGKPMSIANYKGKVVLIDFWATWCLPCLVQFPAIIATYQKYHNQGFDIIGVSLDTDRKRLLFFVTQNNLTWQEYCDGQRWNSMLAAKYGIQSVPMNYLLDRDGKIIGKDLRGQQLTDAVAKALGSK